VAAVNVGPTLAAAVIAAAAAAAAVTVSESIVSMLAVQFGRMSPQLGAGSSVGSAAPVVVLATVVVAAANAAAAAAVAAVAQEREYVAVQRAPWNNGPPAAVAQWMWNATPEEAAAQ